MSLIDSTSYTTSFKLPMFFATLLKEDESFYTFEIRFKILQSEIFNKSLSKVSMTFINPDVSLQLENKRTKKLTSDPGENAIRNVQLQVTNEINYAVASKQKIIFKKDVNLQPYVSKDALLELKSKKRIEEISSLYSFVDSLEIDNDDVTYPQSNLDATSVRMQNIKLLSQFLIDPSDVSYQTNEVLSDSSKKIISELQNYYLGEALSSCQKEPVYYKSVKKLIFKDEVTIKTIVELPASLLNAALNLQFDIFSFERESPIQTVQSAIDVSKQSEYLKIDNRNPKISYLKDLLAIDQTSNFDAFTVKVKQINNSAYCTSYTDFYKGSFEKGKTKNRVYTRAPSKPTNKITIYRCMSKDSKSSIENPFFKNIVVGDPIDMDTTGLVIEKNDRSPKSVSIKIVNPPYYASQAQVYRRRQNGGGALERPVIVANFFNINKTSTTRIFDNSVGAGETYEYFLKYKTLDGRVKNSVSRTYRHPTYPNNSVASSLEIIGIRTEDGEQSVDLEATTDIDASDYKSINSLITAYNSNNSYNAELNQNEKDIREKSIFASKLARLNLKTGVRDFFNKLAAEAPDAGKQILSDDKRTRSLNGVPPIDPSANYSYELITYLKDPSELLKDQVITVKGYPVGKSGKFKTYSYNPYKWNQDSTFIDGTIMSLDEKGKMVSSSPLDVGEVGITATATLSSKIILKSIYDLFADRVDVDKVKVSWKITGDVSDYDHFVVVKESSKKRKLIGSVFSQNFIDVLEKNDKGTVVYYVIPVLKDYYVSKAEKTNALLVDPDDFI